MDLEPFDLVQGGKVKFEASAPSSSSEPSAGYLYLRVGIGLQLDLPNKMVRFSGEIRPFVFAVFEGNNKLWISSDEYITSESLSREAVQEGIQRSSSQRAFQTETQAAV